MTGRKPEELRNPVEFPSLLSHVWSFFLELHHSRSAGFAGPNPITYPDIDAWSRLHKIDVLPQDVSVIKELDKIYLRTSNG